MQNTKNTEQLVEIVNSCLPNEYVAHANQHKPWITVSPRDNLERKLLVIYHHIDILSVYDKVMFPIANQIASIYRENTGTDLSIRNRTGKDLSEACDTH